MTLKYNKEYKLEFDFRDLLCSVKDDDKIKLIEDLSCDDTIIKHVADQILDGFTENCYHGAIECGASPSPFCALDRARREISKRSSEIAKKEIEDLEKSLKETRNELRELREEIYNTRNKF